MKNSKNRLINAPRLKIIMLAIVLYPLVFSLISAADVSKTFTKAVDEKYGTIQIKDISNVLQVEYKLLENSDYCLKNCYAEGIAVLNTDAKLFDGIQFKNLNNNKDMTIQSKLYYSDNQGDKGS